MSVKGKLPDGAVDEVQVERLAEAAHAAADAGAVGWMLWNPRNRYTVEALAPERRG